MSEVTFSVEKKIQWTFLGGRFLGNTRKNAEKSHVAVLVPKSVYGGVGGLKDQQNVT